MATAEKRISLQTYFTIQGSRFTPDAAAMIGAELAALADAGVVTTKQIVDRARYRESKLHAFFDWDDARAAAKYREQTAYEMANAILVTGPAGTPERAFKVVRVVDIKKVGPEHSRAATSSSMPVVAVKTEPAVPTPDRKASRAISELESWCMRWRSLYTTDPDFANRTMLVFSAVEATVRHGPK